MKLELNFEILKKMMEKYGEDEQMRQAMGECGEFIAAAQNYYRSKTYGNRTEKLEDLLEEAVDVYFMMQQMRYLSPKLFDEICIKKRKIIIDKAFKE